MRKTSVWVLCGLMGVATAAVAAAQTGSTGAMGTESGSMGSSSGSMSGSSDMSKSTTMHKSTKHHTAAKSHSVSGEVTAVDATAKTMTVKPKKGADVNLSWNDKTVVTPKGQDVKQGDMVSASYKMSGDTKMATRVRIKPAKATAAAPAAATTPK
jgi:hypothetical protein